MSIFEKDKQINKSELKGDLDMLLNASLSAICHCYDNTKGLFPDDCTCDDRERISEAIAMLISYHNDLYNKYNL